MGWSVRGDEGPARAFEGKGFMTALEREKVITTQDASNSVCLCLVFNRPDK